MDSFGRLRNERVLNIPALASSQKIFCLVENPVGRVVIAVDITVDEDGLTINGRGGQTGMVLRKYHIYIFKYVFLTLVCE